MGLEVICRKVTGAWVVGFRYRCAARVEDGGGRVTVSGGAGTSEGIGREIAGDSSELRADFALFFGLGFSILDLD